MIAFALLVIWMIASFLHWRWNPLDHKPFALVLDALAQGLLWVFVISLAGLSAIILWCWAFGLSLPWGLV